MTLEPDLPMAGRREADAAIPLRIWATSAMAVTAVFAALAVSFFGGSLDSRVLRTAPPGVAPLRVADTLFQGPMIEGRSATSCDKDAIRNLATALIDSNQFDQAAADLKDIGARCARFR